MNKTPRIVTLTSDASLWCLRPCGYLMERFWPGQRVLVGGYSKPQYDLPDGFEFVSLGDFADYPVTKWSDGLVKLLGMIDDELIIWHMDDFWLVRQVNVDAIDMLADYMRHRPEVVRVDLTIDRLYAANAGDIGPWGHLDLIANHVPVPYHFSWQTGIWRRSELLKYLRPGETPWTTEWAGTTRMNDAHAIVIGTRQYPVRYVIAVQNGVYTPHGGYSRPCTPIPQKELDYIYAQGWVPESVMREGEQHE